MRIRMIMPFALVLMGGCEMKSIDMDNAKTIVQSHMMSKKYDGCSLQYEDPMRVPSGWFFVVTSKRYLESNNLSDIMLGGTNIFVLNNGSAIDIPVQINTKEKIELYIKYHHH